MQVVKRTGKLAYVWQGMGQLPALVEQLRKEEVDGLPVIDRKGSMQAQQPDKQATHSLWALSRKFIRLMLTTKVRLFPQSQSDCSLLPALRPMACFVLAPEVP